MALSGEPGVLRIRLLHDVRRYSRWEHRQVWKHPAQPDVRPCPGGAPSAPAFDEYWEALRALCGRIRNGRLAELRFGRGKPVGAKTSEGGRRFKRLVRELSLGQESATSQD